ncbi:MAG TPA: alkaline phosphatase family protein [Solirubrobacteraceae bacterium]|nr:alkaline phosphatase family protein [Solirubrobacteraceae bacterium]
MPHSSTALRAALTSLVRRARLAQTWIALALVLLACALASGSASAAAFKPTRIHHVFVIVLENEGYAATFGNPSADPYLAETLPSEGALLESYYATGHASNDNYVSLVSGQPPNAQNQADCPKFDNFTGALMLSSGVESGTGCVYPAEVPNVGIQLSARKLSWKGYMEDMGNNPARESAACGHPALEATDETQKAVAGDGYATRHDPFVYFHSVIDDQAYCEKHVVALGSPTGAMPSTAPKGETGLATDLGAVAKTPRLSFITPNLCNDGHDYPCANQPSGASALADIDTFLETWVPKITSSQAYRENGLLEIVFDEAANSETEACCGEMPGPGSPSPGITGPGGGRVGALLLSPFIRPGTVSTTPYNHYSSLASWESIFALPRLADAASVPAVFGSDVFAGR